MDDLTLQRLRAAEQRYFADWQVLVHEKHGNTPEAREAQRAYFSAVLDRMKYERSLADDRAIQDQGNADAGGDPGVHRD